MIYKNGLIGRLFLGSVVVILLFLPVSVNAQFDFGGGMQAIDESSASQIMAMKDTACEQAKIAAKEMSQDEWDLAKQEMDQGLKQYENMLKQYEKLGSGRLDFSSALKAMEDVVENSKRCGDQARGGCLIATAAYGTELAPQVQMLREIRDSKLLQTQSGTDFMSAFNTLYYSFSPTVAGWQHDNPAFNEFVRVSITPLITTMSILSYVDIDSESQMIGYGIGTILLNVGMYFVAPAVVIHKILSRNKQ